MKKAFKNIVISALCIASVVTTIISAIPVAHADSSSILSTNTALGSPVLNDDFVVEDWNKWEMEVWGIYLSNFCQPLVDTYETAFKTGAGGNNGAGYKALCFGSGSDPENNETIQALCDEAILYQKTVTKQLYVTYTTLIYNDTDLEDKDTSKADANTVEPRPANFNDLLFINGDDDNKTCASSIEYALVQQSLGFDELLKFDRPSGSTLGSNNQDYTSIAHAEVVHIPTFWVKNNGGNGNKYIKILDYNDSWDLQMANILFSSERFIADETFQGKFTELMQGQYPIVLDAFGNITTQDKLMVIPAAVNPNLTKEKQINLLNSWIFNGYNSTYSDEDLISSLCQYRTNYGGLPAFVDSDKLKGTVLLYYDMDTIMYNLKQTGQYNDSSAHYGKALKEFFDTDITSKTNQYQLKIESVGLDDSYLNFFNAITPWEQTNLTTSLLSNALQSNKNRPKMLYQIIDTKGNKIPLFTEDNANAVIVAPQLLGSGTGSARDRAEGVRMFYNYLYEVYCGKHGEAAATWLRNNLENNETTDTFEHFVNNVATKYWDDFVKTYPEYKNERWRKDWLDWGKNNSVSDRSNRLVKVYPISTTMKTIAQVMGLVDGTEFNVYCTLVYATYLDWYGIGNAKTIGGDDPSEFNPDIFDGQSDILNLDITDPKFKGQSKVDREEEILNLGYLMLSPEKGRDYRKQLIYNGIEDFVYEQYNRIVYGGKDSMYSGTASKSNSGFLAIETFTDNPFTSWFVNGYASVVIWFLMGTVIIIILVGLLKKRKFSWYLLNVILAVNLILLVPSSGEIVPYVTSRFIESMFSSKMTYWAVSEGISNAAIESNQFNIDSDDEADLVMSLVKTLNVVYTDRSLMLKQDISQKITQKTVGVYNDIQNIRSARWLLPIVMEQMTGDNNTTDYLYVKLSNVWDDMSNLYWYYNRGDTLNMTEPTATSQQNDDAAVSYGTAEGDMKDSETYSLVKDYFDDYAIIDRDDRYNNYNYRSYSYTQYDNADQVHLYAWALDPNDHLGIQIPTRGNIGANYKNADSWQTYIDSVATKSNLKDIFATNSAIGTNNIESTADQYNRQDRSTIHADYSYLKTTEDIAYYFFYVVKDTFATEYQLGKVIGMLQGNTQNGINDETVRESFMHSTITSNIEGDRYQDSGFRTSDPNIQYTPYVRDILDLENLFKNVVPYLYQTQLLTGGFDGKSGVLGDSTITNLQYYEGELQSWMYRCNWATKLMENPELSKPTAVKDSAGNKYIVNNPLLYECYPTERPMIFSEAQMHAYGLIEADLSLVELKCIEVNKNTRNKWTMLINYAGTPELTKEVIYRQMATDAAMIFNEEFSTLGILNNIYKMYPQSIDLRYLSFDSIMKMLMLNVSKNSNYVYGDTMQTLISDSDMFQALLLLVDAFICSAIIPLGRTFLLALIFYLGFGALIRGILSDGKQKAKIACGQLVCNIIFMLLTLIYYAVFAILMAVTSTDEVLSVSQITAKPGNPAWVLIIVMLASGVYVWFMWKMIKFCGINYKDMGYEFMSMIASNTVEKIQDGMANLSSNLANWASRVGGEEGNNKSFQTGNINSIRGTGNKEAPTQDVNLRSTDDEVLTLKKESESTESVEEMSQHAYTTGESIDFDNSVTAQDIDSQIEHGRQMSEN